MAEIRLAPRKEAVLLGCKDRRLTAAADHHAGVGLGRRDGWLRIVGRLGGLAVVIRVGLLLGLLLGFFHHPDMDGILIHESLPRAYMGGGNDEVVVTRVPLGQLGQGLLGLRQCPQGQIPVDLDRLQVVEGGKVEGQGLPLGHGGGHHVLDQMLKDTLRTAEMIHHLFLQFGVVVARLQQMPHGEVGLAAVDHADGGVIVHRRIYLQHKGVLVQALGVFVLGVADLGVDIQHHDVAAVAGEGVQQVNGGVRAFGREGDLLKDFAVSEGDHLKDSDIPQGHVVGQGQLVGISRRPQNGKHIPEPIQHIHRASAVGVISLQLPLFVSMLSRFPYAVPLGVHRDAVRDHRHRPFFLLGVLGEGRGDDAVIRVGQAPVDAMARVGVGGINIHGGPRQSDPHKHRHRHHDPRDSRRHTALAHAGKEGGDPLPRRGRSYGHRLGQRGGKDHIIVQTLQQFKRGKPLDLLFLHTLYPLSCR